jgi:ATP-dependent DNA helicase DinG
MADLCAVTAGRALLLFTSFRNMRIAEAYLREVLPFPLLVQGERPRHLLLAAMRERVGSVLLATPELLGGRRRPGRSAVARRHGSDPVRGSRRSADRGPHRSHPRRRRRAVQRLPAAARGAGAASRDSAVSSATRTDRGIVAVLDGRVAAQSYARR